MIHWCDIFLLCEVDPPGYFASLGRLLSHSELRQCTIKSDLEIWAQLRPEFNSLNNQLWFPSDIIVDICIRMYPVQEVGCRCFGEVNVVRADRLP